MIATLALALSLSERLDPLMDSPELNGSLAEAVVMRLNGEILYSRNADIRVVPASNQKILACSFALEPLGADERMSTTFWKEGDDIFIDASGDPTITAEQWQKARAALKPGVNSMIYVYSPFTVDVPPGWEFDDLPFRYAARVHALTVNRGRYTITRKNGEAVAPSWAGVQVRYSPGEGALSTSFNNTWDIVTLKGTLPKEGEVVGEYALPNPSQSVARLMGGRLKFVSGEALPEREADYRIEGPTVGELVKAALEPSDNIITEHLLLRAGGLGGYEGKNPYTVAAAELNKYLTEVVGVPEDSVRAQDGSGMSRHNLVTGRAMAQILRHVSLQPFFQIFLDALPQPGEGTLSNRLKGLPVSAKTGTLDAVVSLSGYVQPPGQEPVIFTMISNHHVKGSGTIRVIQDKMVQEIRDFLVSERQIYEYGIWCGQPQKTALPYASFDSSAFHWPGRFDRHGSFAR